MSRAAPAAAIAVIWIVLTAATGKTYHLTPPLIAAAPGAVARWRAPASATALGVMGSGLSTVALGWLVIVALRIEPDATVIAGQPGGVVGEVILGAVAGALVGAALATRGRFRAGWRHSVESEPES
jgi:hypothetical protein